MTNRERLIAALSKQPTDRLPWSPLIDPYFVGSLKKQGYDMDLLSAMRHIGNDIMERHVASPLHEYKNVEITTSVSGKVRTIQYKTPVGTVYSEHTQTDTTEFKTRHEIHTLEDIKTYQYIVENTTVKTNVDAFVKRDTEIGDSGIAVPSGPMSPVQEVLQFLGGVENTVYLMCDYPDEMDELYAAMHERNKKTYDILATYPAHVFIDYEDTSTTVMSRDMFVNYSAPMINDYAGIMHKAGKTFITHMCGKLSGFANEIGACHMDGVDSVCPGPTGDLNSWDARAKWGEGKIIIGGIEPPMLARMTVSECLHYVADIIDNMPQFNGFILSTGDAVPYGTPIENMMAITEYITLLGGNSLSNGVDRDPISALVAKYQK